MSSIMKKAQLVFTPLPGIGHLVSTIEFAKHLLNRDDAFLITILVMSPPFAPEIDTYSQSMAATDTRIQFIKLPQVIPPLDPFKSPESFMSMFIEGHKPYVKATIIKHVMSNDSVPFVGLVVDLFCTCMIDVANELDIPSYTFFPSGAAFLGLMLYLPNRHDQIGTEFKETDPDSIIPSYINPVPSWVLPSALFNKDGGYTSFQNIARKLRETKGIIVNSFKELESHAVNSFLNDDDTPPIFTVGPILDLKGQSYIGSNVSQSNEIIKWLDNQPAQSVIFLCFGSVGSLSEPQLKEIAFGLERSHCRFLWSIRKPPPKDQFEVPNDFVNYNEVLPDGFLERTKSIGMICGWAPQVQVLAHKAIGGFVSHCGWNSVLESLWFGVPIITWPLYAEQQINAFELVRDLGLAVELRLDCRMDATGLVMADEIVKSVKCLMQGNTEIRNKVRAMTEMSRQAVVDGGSSFTAFQHLIDLMLGNKS